MPTGAEGIWDEHRNQQVNVMGLGSEVGTAAATTGAATLNALIGIVTSEDLTTAQNALYTLTLTNSKIAAGDHVIVTLGNGTNTQGTPVLCTSTVTASTLTCIVSNQHASAQALNGTLKFYFQVVKAL